MPAAFGVDDEVVAESFGANDEVVAAFGQDDEVVGYPSKDGQRNLTTKAAGVDARTDPFFQTTPSDPYAGAVEEMVRPITEKLPAVTDDAAEALALMKYAEDTQPGRWQKQPQTVGEWTRFMLGGAFSPIKQTESAVESALIAVGAAKPGDRLLYRPSEALERHYGDKTLPRVPPKEGLPGQVTGGLANSAIGLADFLMTPEGTLSLGIGQVPKTLQKIILTIFAGKMATEAPEAFRKAYEAAKAGDVQGAVEHVTSGTGAVAFSALLAKHGAFPEAPKPSGLTAESFKEPQERSIPVESVKESSIPKTDQAVESVTEAKGPVLQPPAPTPTAAVSESGTVPVSAGNIPPARATLPLEEAQGRPTQPLSTEGATEQTFSTPTTRLTPPASAASFMEKLPPVAEFETVRPSDIALARTLDAPAKRAEFKRNITAALLQTERGEVSQADLVSALKGYDSIWGKTDPLPDGLLKYLGVEKQAEPISMGGATPAELTPAPLKTAVKNVEMDKAREARNLDPILGPERQKNTEVWDRVMAKIDNDPGWQDRLISELKDKPRTPSADEIVALDHRYADLQNEYSKAMRDGEQHAKDGYELGMEEAKKRAAFYEDRLNDFEQVAKRSLTEWGRAGQMSQRLIKEDFSLASMESRMRAAKGFKPLTPEEHAQIKGLREKLDAAEKALTEAEGKGVEKATRRAQADVNIVREEFNRSVQVAREKVIWDDMTVFQKTTRTAANAYDAGRLILTTGEFSFVLRQGKMNMLSHPIRTTMAIPSAIRAMRSKEASRRIEHEVLSHPDAAQAKRDGLALMDEGSPLARQEEIIMGRWGDAIPVVSAFNRAARVFLNKIRFDTWRAMRRSRGNVSPEAGKALAAYVNESTGRGSLGAAEGSAVLLGRAFFAPRWVVSRIQYGIGHSLWKKSDARTRAVIASEYARTLVGMGVYYSLLSWYFNDADIEPDLRSSDASKLRMGDTRLDILTGLAQLATFGARTVTGESKTSKGKVVAIRGDQMKYGQADWREYAGRFAWSKAHPIPGAIANLFSGTDLGGNVVTPEGELLKFGQPITYVDIYEALLAQGIPRGTALGLLAWLGEGLQTYGNKPKK